MGTRYQVAADAVLLAHFAYVAFVVLGQLAILVGVISRWQCTKNFTFRLLHLLAILIVVAESLLGITCPLTTWEQSLRTAAGNTTYQGDFIASWVQSVLFYEAPAWVFTLCYSLFGLLVVATFIWAPPKMPLRRGDDQPRS